MLNPLLDLYCFKASIQFNSNSDDKLLHERALHANWQIDWTRRIRLDRARLSAD